MNYKSFIIDRNNWELEIDLVFDMKTILYDRLVKSGYKNVDFNRAIYQYFNVLKRIILQKPRKIHKSKEFLCPVLYNTALENFEKKVRMGETLIPFLSDKLLDASYSDRMLNDWNIYHFHLTNRFNDNGWAKRSDYELFAYVTDTDMYMIQVYKHSNSMIYYQKEIVEIIYNNWPELIERFHIKGVNSLAEKYCDKQYKILRDSNISTFIELGDSLIFGMIGGGYMSDGSSGEAMRRSDFWHNRLKQVQTIIINNMHLLTQTIKQISRNDTPKYIIKMLWIDNEKEFTFAETSCHVIIQLNIEKGYWRVCRPFELFG